MREKIVFAPGLNGNELSANLALHGINSIGMRICGATALARLALMRSGISIEEIYIDEREETVIMADAVSDEPYFSNASYSDVKEISVAIRKMRGLLSADNESAFLQEVLPSGLFLKKNLALLHVYQHYMESLASKNALDAVSLVRKAITESRIIDADFLVLDEFPLTPLEQALLDRVSGGKYSRVKILDLFEADSKPLQISRIRNCYGAPNEVESILADIYTGKSLDRCTVAVTDTLTYGQLFFYYALLYGLPITFGCGIPIANSNPAKLLSLYLNWMGKGFFGAESIFAMLRSEAFDREKIYDLFPDKDADFHWSTFYEILGDLRFTNDALANEKRIADFRTAIDEDAKHLSVESEKQIESIRRKQSCIPSLEILSRELALPVEDFITKYAHIRRGSKTSADKLLEMLDISASGVIYDELKAVRGSRLEQVINDIIPYLLKMAVCVQQCEGGKLHVTGIDNAFSSMRSNMYLAGLSASNYPGASRENYLLLDADIKLFGSCADNYTAEGLIRRKRDTLLSLAHTLSSLGSSIDVSYAGLNVSELKRENASSLIFELFREAYGINSTTEELDAHVSQIGYFEPALSPSRLIGDAYVQGDTVLSSQSIVTPCEAAYPSWMTKIYSPTALETFFTCPRKFMIRYILGIPEPEDFDPFEIISALDTGTLAHSLMEELGSSDMNKEAFLRRSGDYFDRFLAEHPPLIVENVSAIRNQFLDMMETAFDMDPHRNVILEEKDIACTHESGVRMHGFPDRVEKLDDGSVLIVDFKTGRRIKHVQDDIDTCLQVVVYSYLMEQNGFEVSGCEYRYIRLGETIRCRYDLEMKERLAAKLEQFKTGIQNGSFPIAEPSEDEDDPCRYCRYITVCGRAAEEESVE